MKKEALRKFSDRAIALCYITLIFTFGVPKFTSFNYDPNLDLVKLAPHLLTFVFTFITIGAFWVAQSRILCLIPELSPKMAWQYKLYFICLVLVSITAVTLSSDPFAKLPLFSYNLLLLLTAILHVSLLYAALRKDNIQRNSPITSLRSSLKKTALTGPACYLLGIAACWINVYASFLCISMATTFYIFFMRTVKVSPASTSYIN